MTGKTPSVPSAGTGAGAIHSIHLALDAATGVGRAVLDGFARYSEHRTDWRCGMVSGTGEKPAGPPHADALLGFVTARLAARWTAEERRYVVNVSRGGDHPGIASVTCDDIAIGRMAAEYLLGKGLESFAWCGAPSGRADGFAERLDEDGRRPACLMRPDAPDDALETWLAGLPPRTGVFTFNDGLALRVLWAVQTTGRAAPEDLAVVGVDADTVLSVLAPESITSVDPDFEAIGYRASELLDRALQGDDVGTERIRIPPRGVVERASSDFPGVADRVAIQAARHIRRYACAGAQVSDVVAAVPLSRRSLERRFRRVFGRTMLEEIHRIRVAEAVRLLAATRLPVATIAREVGFNSHERLTRVFRAATGLSPAAYRRKHSSEIAGGSPPASRRGE